MARIDSRAILGRLALFAATLIWGTAFVVQKNTLDSLTPFWLLAIRFLVAGVILLLFSLNKIKKLDRRCLLLGSAMGACLFFAYATQTYGLAHTTPGKNAFLTAAYCVMVPFLNWAFTKRRPDRFNIAAAVMAIVGIGLVSLSDDLSVGIGDALTLVCAVFYALHIIVSDRAVDGSSIMLLIVVQAFVCGFLCLGGALVSEPLPSAIPEDAVFAMVYLCVLSTALTEFLQTYGQKHTPPAPAAVIMALESVIGVAASLLFYSGEVLTPRIAAGFVLIFVAVIISETKLSFLKRKAK